MGGLFLAFFMRVCYNALTLLKGESAMNRKRLQFYKALFFVYLAILFWILFNRSRYVAGSPYFELRW